MESASENADTDSPPPRASVGGDPPSDRLAVAEQLDDSTPMTVAEICNKILGVIYGGVIGDIVGQGEEFTDLSFNAEQLLVTAASFSATDGFRLPVFMERLKGLVAVKGGDKYTADVVAHEDFVKDPGQESLRVFKTYNNYDVEDAGIHDRGLVEATEGGAPLIRAVFLGVFADWDNYAVGACLATHYDARVIAASYIAASFTRSMMLGRPTVIREIMESAVYTITTLERITNKFVVREMMRVLVPAVMLDPARHHEISGADDSALKCLSAGVWALSTITGDPPTYAAAEVGGRISEALAAIQSRGGSAIQNCGLAGAMMGGEAGYKGLPLGVLGRLPPAAAANVRGVAVSFLRAIKLLGGDEAIEEALSDRPPLSAEPTPAGAADVPALAGGERLVDVDEPVKRADPVPLEPVDGGVED